MREQLVQLLKLQSSDAKVKELDASVAQIPAKLEPLKRDLAKLEGMLGGERAKLAETEAWQKSQREYIERERESLKNANAKFQASKNSKEFNASSREVENKRKAIADREAELKKVGEATTSSIGALDSRGKDVDALRDELASNEAGIADQLGAAKAALETAKAARDEARKSVEAKWLKIYDSLSAKRGYAVALVIKGVCQGCHMALPPQLNNILARAESIETCPRCSRLVYRRELIDPEGAAADAAAEAAATAAALEAEKAKKAKPAKAPKVPKAPKAPKAPKKPKATKETAAVAPPTEGEGEGEGEGAGDDDAAAASTDDDAAPASDDDAAE